MPETVECHSGFEYGERPLAFHWQGQRLVVIDTLARWRTPEGKRFRVRTAGDQIFELFYHERDDVWQIHPLKEQP